MEISARRPASYNLNLPTAPVAPCLPILCPGFPKMYSMQHMDSSCDHSGNGMYSTTPKLGVHDGVQTMHLPKQENFIQSTYSAITSLISEHLLRATSSMIPNIEAAITNRSLSVKIVPNEGIIPDNFYETLTGSAEKMLTDNFYNNATRNKESLFIADHFYSSTTLNMKSQTADNFHKNRNQNTVSSKTNLDCIPNDTPLVSEFKRSDIEDSFVDCTKLMPDKFRATVEDCAFATNKSTANVKNKNKNEARSSTNSLCTDKETIVNTLCENDGTDNKIGDFPNSQKASAIEFCDSSTEVDTELIERDELTTNDLESIDQCSSSSTSAAYQSVFSNLFTDLSGMVQKVVSHVSDRLHLQTDAMDYETTDKRPYSPKLRCKQNPVDVARGRGRGRGRSQLRRSGVSQARHRQERIRQHISADIQEDLDDWNEFEELQNQDVPNTPNVDENGTRIRYDADGTPFTHSPKGPLTFTVFELKPRRRKQKKTKNVDNEKIKVPTRVRYVAECLVDGDVYKRNEHEEEFEVERKTFRPRLLSESSVDSEDSCCIVFETGSDSEYETDYDYETTSEEEEKEEEDQFDDGFRTPSKKVRFSSTPTVHTMIKWDYAYRAARRGPWEEMARDRERFKGRTNCIGRVLNPILTPQHRSHIWQQRFASEV